MDIPQLLRHVDHTILSPCATWEQVKTACDQALAHNTATVCIPPRYVKRAADYVGSRLKLCTVVGFPNGYQDTAVKAFETERALADGADEIDMVINLGWLKDGLIDLVEQEVRQ